MELDSALWSLYESSDEDKRSSYSAGRCLGIAEALAIILNPYDPNVDEVRREAMRRYKTRGSS